MDAVTLDQNLHQKTTCSICLTFFSNLVTITCGHSFCQVCLTRSMENGVTHFPCPECGKDFHSLSGLNVHLLKLSSVCKNLNSQNLKNPVGQRYCQKHQQVLKFFYKEDQTSLCISCTEGQEHAAHTFSPIKEAALNCRKKLKDTLSHLRKKIKKWKELKISFKSSQKNESKELLKISESLLSEKSESFSKELRKYSFSPELRKYPITGMKNWLEKFKVNITMDPRTASNFLVISEDLKKVKHRDNCPEQSNFPEKCHLVFAEQSFHSDFHYCEVDVKEQLQWALGLATKSLRKKKRTKEFSVEHLCMLRCEKRGNKFYLDTRPESVCQQMKDPMSIIGIYLDYPRRILQFYDTINATLICRMHIVPLAKSVKPLFSPCPPMPGTTVGYMKICPL